MAQINTVLGPVDDSELGIVLPHERIVDDLTGADNRPAAGNAAIIRQWVTREFEDLASHGARTLIEVTPIGCGRDVDLMRRVQEATHLRIVAATGLGPPGRRPDWVAQRKPKHVADALIKELTEGIAGTDSRAGVISLVTDAGGDEGREVLKAIGRAHEKTGAPVIAWAPDRRAERLDALEQAGVPAHGVALSHAGRGATVEEMTALAGRGASLIFTNWGIPERVNDADLVGFITQLQSAGLGDRVMISVDFGFRIRRADAVEWPLFGVPGRTYAYLFRVVLPMMRALGLTDGDLWQLMVANPAAFLAHGGQGDETCRFCAHHRH